MNRNLLLIAIAAVAVVVVAAGVLFLGNGPQGSLSGSIGQKSTTLTLNASTCSVPDGRGNVSFTLSGELRDSDGAPVAGKTIALRTASVADGRSAVGPTMEFATTDLNGGYTFAKNEPATPGYDADTYRYYGTAFSGDAEYASCSSATVRKLC